MRKFYNYKKHLLVIFEDQAYKDYYLGFTNHHCFNDTEIFAGDVFGGWLKIQQQVSDDSLATLEHLKRFENAYVLALLDSDKHEKRIAQIKQKIPKIYHDRIFLLSSLNEAENIKDDIGEGKKETIGYQFAEDCYNNDCNLWQKPMLVHNLAELKRLKQAFDFFA